MQLTLEGEEKETWYCIHCNYYGHEHNKGMCPNCGWVVYNEKDVEEKFLNSNVYPKLIKNYNKARRNKNGDS